MLDFARGRGYPRTSSKGLGDLLGTSFFALYLDGDAYPMGCKDNVSRVLGKLGPLVTESEYEKIVVEAGFADMAALQAFVDNLKPMFGAAVQGAVNNPTKEVPD